MLGMDSWKSGNDKREKGYPFPSALLASLCLCMIRRTPPYLACDTLTEARDHLRPSNVVGTQAMVPER